MADQAPTSTTSPILLRIPSRYQSTSPSSPQNPLSTSNPGTSTYSHPPLSFLERTWAITHSTLPMWRKAKNVRITYKIIPNTKGAIHIEDLVESEPTEKTWMPQPKQIKGIDTLAPGGGKMGDQVGEEVGGNWNWRGKGLLKVATSYWEVVGWGERDGERWMVTWFAPSLFTPAGVDVYSDKMQGGTEGLVRDVLKALEDMDCKEVGELCKGEMKAVKIDDVQ